MRPLLLLGVIAVAALSHTARAQTPARSSNDCIARQAAATTGGVTTKFESVKVPSGNPVIRLAPGEPHNFVVRVVVDATGRPDSSTIELPAELDTASANAIRRVYPSWRFIPAMIGSCPVSQVVTAKLSRQ